MMWTTFTPVDSLNDALHLFFWVCDDLMRRLVVNSRKHPLTVRAISWLLGAPRPFYAKHLLRLSWPQKI